MADIQPIVIEVELNDGSLQQTFIKAESQAKKTGTNIGNSLEKGVSSVGNSASSGAIGIESLAASFRNLAPYAAAAYGAVKSFQTIIDNSTAAEKIRNVEIQFNNLAATASLSGKAISDGLVTAADGLVDTEEILQSATNGLITFGSEAAKLPQLLTIARQASSAFGGDVLQQFEAIQGAIVSGRATALKQVGLAVDFKKAQDDLAKSLGITNAQLTEQEKITANLNAVINTAKSSYSGIDLELNKVQNQTARLSTAFGELKDSSVIASDTIFGGLVSTIKGSLTDAIVTLTNVIDRNFGSGVKNIDAQIQGLNKSIKATQENLENDRWMMSASEIKFYNEQIEATKLKIKDLENKKISIKFDAPVVGSIPLGPSSEEFTAFKARQAEIEKIRADQLVKVQAADAAELASRQGLFNSIAAQRSAELQNLVTNNAAQDQINLASDALFAARSVQLALLETQRQQQIEAAKTSFVTNQVTNEQIKAQTLLAIDQKYATDKLAIQDQLNKDIEVSQKKAQERALKINNATAQAGSQLFQSAASSIGESLANGTDAWESFKNAALGIVGDMLISIGMAVAGVGTAIEFVRKSLETLTGIGAVTIGFALVALGASLKSLSGSGRSGASSATSSVGGTSSSGSSGATTTSVPITTPEAVKAKAFDTSVIVNIQGDVLDSQDTGMRIVDILNSSFDKKGVKINRGAIA